MQHHVARLLQSKPLRTTALQCALLVGWLSGCAAGAEPNREAVLAMVLPRDALEIDPRFVSDPYGLKLTRVIFGSLTRIDPQSLEPVPDLAESIEAVSSSEYRVHLREGLMFSDGSVLDASDVVATYQSVLDPALHARYASTYSMIQRIEAVDALTIEFHLRGPHASFMSDLDLPILRAEDAPHRLAFETDPPLIGAGPYRLVARQPGRIELGPNPHWYAGTPRVPRVRMLVVRDDNTRALRLFSGAADYGLNAVPPGLVPLFTARRGFAVESAPGIGTTYIGINCQSPALQDVRVRRALALAIDRDALIKAKFSGFAKPAISFIPPGHWAFAPDTPRYAFEPERARQLLAEVQAEHGPLPPLVLRCGSDRFRVSIARALAAMFADIGLSVSVQATETATLIADLDRGRFELSLLQIPEVIEPHVLSWWFSSAHVPGPGREGANRWHYLDPQLDAAFELGRSSLDREQRRAAYAQVQKRLGEQLPVIPLWHEDVVAVRSKRAPAIVVPRDGRFTTLAR
jgi:peptide/nickel transport system substrate-binding protein